MALGHGLDDQGSPRAADSRCGQVRHPRACGELDPAGTLSLDPALPARFPAGYRHLGYLQTKAGFTVKTGLPGLTGEAVMRLYDEGAGWLDGSPAPGEPR